ncbi:MAG: radical SAM protein [Kiritimatiellaeota bacterium]|nr:radical SAM protein [Kiritimatiellota bacterium]
MDCTYNLPESKEAFIKRFSRTVREQRIPLTGGMDLTNRCNLRCVHCYIRPEAGEVKEPSELPTKRWLEILDEITEAGCLYFLITGGEPLLRADFPEIYRKARQNGLVVSVFTNGTLADDAILDLFTEYPPAKVEITLYGATEVTYESITQVSGSYRRCMTAIERLRERGVALRLKSVLLTLNEAEFETIEKMAKDWGGKFRMDGYVVPHVNGDKSPLVYRAQPETVAAVEFRDSARAEEWRKLLDDHRKVKRSDSAYSCGAGQTSFHIDAFGHLQICLMEKRQWYDLVNGSFREGWVGALPRIRNRPASQNDPCQKCPDWLLCGCCKPQIAMETGSEIMPPEYVCKLGQARRKEIESMKTKGAGNET